MAAEPAISVQVRLFAMLREAAGKASLELALPAGATVGDALASLGEHEPLGELLARLPVRIAVNREYAWLETILCAGDELALIPPVSGGSGEEGRDEPARIHARVTAAPLSVQSVSALVGDPRAGAIVIFQGVTREVAALDYEAYAEMAAERIESILADCAARHGLRAAAAEHRVGRVTLGEPSVIVAVSASHRAEAFEGARAAIDAIKAQAPIWKREIGEDGRAEWVAGTSPGERRLTGTPPSRMAP